MSDQSLFERFKLIVVEPLSRSIPEASIVVLAACLPNFSAVARSKRRAKEERRPQYRSRTYIFLQRTLAVNVRRLRSEFGWTQEEAAFECGMSPRLLQSIEAAKPNVTFTTLARLCEGFEVEAYELLAR